MKKAKKQRGEKEEEREKERMEKRKKSSGGVFARTGIWPCCVAAPPRESEFLFTAVALVASRVDRCIEKEKNNFEKNGRLRSLYGLKKKYLSLRRTCRPWSTLSIIVVPSFPS